MRKHVRSALSAFVPLLLAACASQAPSGGPLPAAGSARVARPGSASGYVFVENTNTTISVYAIAKSGALTEVSGSPFYSYTNSPGAFGIAVDPQGAFLYASGSVSANVASFSIGSSGGLTLLSQSTNAGVGASGLFIPKGDKRLYAADAVNGGSIAAFDIAKKSGKLSAVKGSPFTVSCPGFCSSNPSMAVTSGNYLYTVDTYGWYVSAFRLAKNGALTELNSYATHEGPTAAVMTPKGTYLYVTNGASGDVSAYSAAGGVLTQLAGSPFAAGGTPLGIAMTANGKFVVHRRLRGRHDLRLFDPRRRRSRPAWRLPVRRRQRSRADRAWSR